MGIGAQLFLTKRQQRFMECMNFVEICKFVLYKPSKSIVEQTILYAIVVTGQQQDFVDSKSHLCDNVGG